MPGRGRSQPMAVKYWSSAGLMLTYWCNARCASCYVCCGPDRSEWIDVDFAIRLWGQLADASPHGCRVHISGGEPFGDFQRLLELCRAAGRAKLGGAQKIETNAFWATDERLVADRLRALDAAGIGRLVISSDPYHQQFVPIERCRLAARIAEQVLGADRLQVRWRDWLADGFDTSRLDEGRRAELFAAYASRGRDRYNGRAARLLGGAGLPKPITNFVDTACNGALLRSKHVHIDPQGRITPGVCAGITLGSAGKLSVVEVRRKLLDDWADRPIVGPLAKAGPLGLLDRAESAGFEPREAYAGKCHLCWDIRSHLARAGLCADELAPRWMYQERMR